MMFINIINSVELFLVTVTTVFGSGLYRMQNMVLYEFVRLYFNVFDTERYII